MAIVKSSLSGLEGVTASKISFTEGLVWYDPEHTTPEQIVAAITSSGYGTEALEAHSDEPNSIPQDCWFFGWFCRTDTVFERPSSAVIVHTNSSQSDASTHFSILV